MEVLKQDDSVCLPSLRLLVSPLRIMSAVMWRVVQQREVVHYGMLADFVSLVTETVPELFSPTCGVELVLGLRAKLVLELCHGVEPLDVQTIQFHLNSVQLSLPTLKYGGSTEAEEAGVHFMNLVQTLIKDPDERENFFQNVFPVEFGSSYDSALQTLMWNFLYRLEQFLPVPDLLQTVSWLGEEVSVSQDCEKFIKNADPLKSLLNHYKCIGHVQNCASSPSTSTGDCIISALSGKREQTNPIISGDLLNPSDNPVSTDMPVCVLDGTDVETVVVMSEWSEIEIHQDVEETSVDGVDASQTSDSELRDSQSGDLKSEINPDPKPVPETSAVENKDGDLSDGGAEQGGDDEFTEVPEAEHMEYDSQHQQNPPSHIISNPECTLNGPALAAEQENSSSTTVAARRSARKPKKTWKLKLVSLQKQRRKTGAPRLANGHKRERKPFTLKRSSETNTEPDEEPGTLNNRDGADLSESQVEDDGTADVSTSPFSCPHCPFTHAQQRYLKSHMKKIHPVVEDNEKEPHVCHVCGKGYRYPGMLKAHERSHTGEQPYQCMASRCGRRFSYIQALRRHRYVHSRKRSQQKSPAGEPAPEDEPEEGRRGDEALAYSCLYCSESFSSLSARREHYKSHTEDELKRCSDCGKILSCQAALIRHKRGHEDNCPHVCPLCGSSFSCSTGFKRHMLTHQPERPYSCTCGKGFTYRGALISHQRSHTAERSYQCAQCGKRFLYPGELRKHERTHSDEKPYLCPHCGKSFKRERILRAHVAGHTEEKIFKCSMCSKTFAYKASLIRHELTHSGERPFLCSDCGKTFFSFGELQKHQRFHTGEKPFQCSHCDKSFTQACYLQLHTRYHTGVRPYPCPQCGKSFFTSCRLKRHMQIHTDIKPYECADCGKRFRQAYVLKVHRRTHLEKELRL